MFCYYRIFSNFLFKGVFRILLPGCIFFVFTASGYSFNCGAGSRVAAMGYSSVGLPGSWSVFHNQAGLAFAEYAEAGFHFENRFGLKQLGNRSAMIIAPVAGGGIGFSYSYFGSTFYNESIGGIAFGRRFGTKVAAGIKFNFLNINIADGYGSSSLLYVEGGLMIEPLEGLIVGLHLVNPSKSVIRSYYDQGIPVLLRFGISANLGDSVTGTFELEKEILQALRVKAGIETGISDNFYLRGGVVSDPIAGSAGIGYRTGRLMTDITIIDHYNIGFTPLISFSYLFE